MTAKTCLGAEMSLLNGATVTFYANLGLSQSAGNVTVTNGGSLVVYGGVLENSTVLDGGIFLLKPGDVLIPAWRLINGVSITQEAVAAVHYFHLELDRHGVIFAENTPAETFLDTGCRGRFQRGTGMPAGPGAFCLPRIEHGFYLQRIQRRLAARAGLAEPPRSGGRLFGYIDIAGPARIAGWARNEAPADEPVELDVWLNGRRLARILADRDRPDLRAAGFGQGCHGFELPLPPGLVGLVRVCRASDGAALPLTDAARAA